MPVASYKTVVNKNSTPVSATDLPMSNIGTNKFQITDVNKRLVSSSNSINITAGGVTINPADYTFDYMFGIVEFDSPVTGTVEIDCNYIPLSAVIGAKSVNINISADVLDSSTFHECQENGGYKHKTLGLIDSSVTIDRLDDLTKFFDTKIKNREKLLLEIKPSGTNNDVIRGWFVIETDDKSFDVAGLIEESLSFQLASDEEVNFSWRY